MGRSGLRRSRRAAWSALLAAGLSGAATLPALLPGRISPGVAALLYVLAVTGASALGGLPAGLTASVFSFVALTFFFTDPLHTLTVDRTQDLVALGVFLVVSMVTGTLLSRAVAQRGRAERREREARLLHHLATRLLSGEPLRAVLARFARAVTDLLQLVRCEITIDVDPEEVIVEGTGGPAGLSESVPMVTRGRVVGRLVAVTAAGRAFDQEERDLLRALAGQMGLAVEAGRLAAEADRARLEAETSQLRAALFSSVSHDLRTPLASITAAVTTLQGRRDDLAVEDRSDLLETIRQEAVRLDRLVGNLMDLSRLRAGALVPDKSPADIEEVIEGVVTRLRPVLERSEVRLVLRGDLPAVPMDVVQIDQVLTNLLENAARFSPPGAEISVYASRWRDHVEVRVADHGPGVPSADRERVLEPFVRDGSAGGTGLGLSIARAIVESHGGRIWIGETPGGGTSVSFRLPLR